MERVQDFLNVYKLVSLFLSFTLCTRPNDVYRKGRFDAPYHKPGRNGRINLGIEEPNGSLTFELPDGETFLVKYDPVMHGPKSESNRKFSLVVSRD